MHTDKTKPNSLRAAYRLLSRPSKSPQLTAEAVQALGPRLSRSTWPETCRRVFSSGRAWALVFAVAIGGMTFINPFILFSPLVLLAFVLFFVPS